MVCLNPSKVTQVLKLVLFYLKIVYIKNQFSFIKYLVLVFLPFILSNILLTSKTRSSNYIAKLQSSNSTSSLSVRPAVGLTTQKCNLSLPSLNTLAVRFIYFSRAAGVLNVLSFNLAALSSFSSLLSFSRIVASLSQQALSPKE